MNHDIIIIGGGPAGMTAGLSAKQYYPNKSILILKSITNGVIPCGIPYMFKTLDKPENNKMCVKPLENNKIQVENENVVKIDKENKKIETESGKIYSYKKLVIATGSTPVKPPIPGVEKQGIYTIEKEMGHMINLKSDLERASDVVIVGGGFIGVELADELSLFEKLTIHIVEFQPTIMSTFDEEFTEEVKDVLEKKGIKILTGQKVVGFNGNERVESVKLSDGSEIPAQVVILGIGSTPNAKLAEESGFKIGSSRGILVDEYLRTYTDPDVFAVGDCAEKKDYFTRKKVPVMLASTATAEARIAGSNLFKIKVVRENRGTLAVYSTKIDNLTLGSAGLTEKNAVNEGFEVVIGRAEIVDRHPATMPQASKTHMKLIFSKQSGLLLGGQVSGGESAGEMVNIIGLALQKATTMTELETLQIATHPKLTAAPTMYPLVMAAQDAISKF